MKCIECHFDNPPDSKFCEECGTQLIASRKAYISATKTLEAPAEKLTRGTTFAGRYEIIEELGKGGMAKVYRVEDKKIREEVALKLIKPEIASNKKTIERFSNELKMARKIAHRNVCRMFDLGEEKGTHYITMEYVPGEDLKRLIRKVGQFNSGKTIFIAKQVCEGLAESHRLGVVHRDLKPQNIMVDEEGNARIMDFGIARSIKTKGITGEGVIIGTPKYMSPEQVEGKEVDQRSDIYSLGVTLYEMVTGKIPFEGNIPLNIVLKHKTEAPRNPRQLNTQIPEDLSRVILKCLEKDKEKRYQSASEVRSELEKIEESIPFTDRTFPKKKPITSRKITVTFGLKKLFIPGLVLIFLIIAVLAIWQIFLKKEDVPITSAKSSIAVLPFADLSPQKNREYLCDGIAETLINALTNIEGLRVPARTSTFSFKGKEKNVYEIGKKLDVETLLEGSVQVMGDRLRITAQLINTDDGYHLWSNHYDRELEDVFAIQDEIAQAIVKSLKIKLLGEKEAPLVKSYTENLEAYNLYLLGRFFWNKRGGEDLKKAIEYFEKAIEKDPSYAFAYSGLADTYIVLGDNLFWPPDNAFPKAKEAALKALEIDGSLAEAYTSLAAIKHEYEWNFTAAEEEFRKAIRIKPGYAPAHFWYAFLLSSMGRHEEAIREIKIARDLDPVAPRISANVGLLLYYARQYNQALEELSRTLELDPYHVAAHEYFGYVYAETGEYEKSISSFRQSIDLEKSNAEMSTDIAYVYALAGSKEKSREMLDNIINYSKQSFISSVSIASVFQALGEKGQVFAWLEKAYSERDAGLVDLKVNPRFDAVCSDPRFKELLKKIGLEK